MSRVTGYTLIRIIRWFVGTLIILAACAFAVANRQSVDILWNPLAPPLGVPVYAVALGALGIGMVTGGLIVWIGTIPLRFSLYRHKKKLAQAQDLNSQPRNAPNAACPEPPLLTSSAP